MTDAGPAGRGLRPSLVARQVLPLWPRSVGTLAVTVEEARLWPVFAVVLGGREPEDDPSLGPLFDLLEQPERFGGAPLAESRCVWAILDPRYALLQLAVQASRPVRFDVDIILPARAVLGTLAQLADGGTVALTTQRQARSLNRRMSVRSAVGKLVVVGCPPSLELAALVETVAASLYG